jgi:hypothetical protein
LDRSCGKWRSITESRGGEEYPTYSKKEEGNWIGQMLRRNCLLKHVIEGKIEGRIEVTGRRGRRRKQLLDDVKERRGHRKLTEEALDCTLGRLRFGRCCGPVVRQTPWWCFGPHSACTCFVFNSEQTATPSLYNIYWVLKPWRSVFTAR